MWGSQPYIEMPVVSTSNGPTSFRMGLGELGVKASVMTERIGMQG